MKNSHSFGSRGEWYVVMQVVLFTLVGMGPRAAPGIPLWPASVATVGRGIGILLVVAGGLLAMTALLNLGRNLTPLPYPKNGSALVQAGAYGLVRHPIYSGLILAALGWAFYQRSTLVLIYALVLLLFFDIKSRQEERWLRNKFPGYVAYQQRVRKLIPFLY